MAARIHKELGVEVETRHGRYGEYRVVVDGETVVDGGLKVAIGLMPPANNTVALVRERLAPDYSSNRTVGSS